MALFKRPSLGDLIKRSQSDIESSIEGADAKLRRTNLNVLAKIHALAVHGLYGFIQFLIDQIFPLTAQKQYLDRHATFWLGTPRIPASYATGFVSFAGADGAVIPEGTVLIRADGIEYATDQELIIVGGTIIGSVTALTAGQIGNTNAATTLNLASPIASVSSTASVGLDNISGGADEETDKRVQDRIHARVQNPPHGGADHDYIAWAKEVAGVTRAWVYGNEMGAGTVTVRFVRDDDVNLIPDAGEVDAVQAYMDPLRPVTVKGFYVVAPIAQPLDFTIQVFPNTAAVKAAVEAELRDLLMREAEPGKTILLSHIREAISLATGETNYLMTVPNADVEHSTGYIATFGEITWV
jgi:uncharacterized phage protein gp47/JayE